MSSSSTSSAAADALAADTASRWLAVLSTPAMSLYADVELLAQALDACVPFVLRRPAAEGDHTPTALPPYSARLSRDERLALERSAPPSPTKIVTLACGLLVASLSRLPADKRNKLQQSPHLVRRLVDHLVRLLEWRVQALPATMPNDVADSEDASTIAHINATMLLMTVCGGLGLMMQMFTVETAAIVQSGGVAHALTVLHQYKDACSTAPASPFSSSSSSPSSPPRRPTREQFTASLTSHLRASVAALFAGEPMPDAAHAFDAPISGLGLGTAGATNSSSTSDRLEAVVAGALGLVQSLCFSPDGCRALLDDPRGDGLLVLLDLARRTTGVRDMLFITTMSVIEVFCETVHEKAPELASRASLREFVAQQLVPLMCGLFTKYRFDEDQASSGASSRASATASTPASTPPRAPLKIALVVLLYTTLCRLMSGLTPDPATFAATFIHAGALTYVLDGMRRFESSAPHGAPVVTAGVTVLHRFCVTGDASVRQAVVDANGKELLLRAMELHKSTSAVVEHACGALQCLDRRADADGGASATATATAATATANAHTFSATSDLAAVTGMLAIILTQLGPQGDATVMSMALAALHHYVAQSSVNATMVALTTNSIAVLVRTLERYAANPHVLAPTCSTLARLVIPVRENDTRTPFGINVVTDAGVDVRANPHGLDAPLVERCKAIVAANGVEALIDAVRAHPTNLVIVCQSCEVLSMHPCFAERLARCNASTVLVDVMKQHDTDIPLLRRACSVLVHCAHTSLGKRLMVATGVLTYAITLLRGIALTDAPLTSFACSLLVELAAGSDMALATLITDSGAIDAVIDAVQAHPMDVATVLYASDLLYSLTAFRELLDRVASTNVPEVMIRSLERHFDDALVVTNVMRVVPNLACNVTHQSRFVELNAIKLYFRVLKRHAFVGDELVPPRTRHEQRVGGLIATTVMGAIINLTTRYLNLDTVAAHDGIRLCVLVARHYVHCRDAATVACAILARLGLDRTRRAVINQHLGLLVALYAHSRYPTSSDARDGVNILAYDPTRDGVGT